MQVGSLSAALVQRIRVVLSFATRQAAKPVLNEQCHSHIRGVQGCVLCLPRLFLKVNILHVSYTIIWKTLDGDVSVCCHRIASRLASDCLPYACEPHMPMSHSEWLGVLDSNSLKVQRHTGLPVCVSQPKGVMSCYVSG